MMGNVAGAIGSAFGVAAGLVSLIDVVLANVGLSTAPYNLLFGLWVLWFVIQGNGFLVVYIQTNRKTALVSFTLGLTAGLEVMMPTQVYFVPLIGIVTLALYDIFGGVTFLRMSGDGRIKSPHAWAGILFVLLGPGMFLTPFPLSLFVIPLLVIVANALALLAFSSPGGTAAPRETAEQPSDGAGLL